MKIIVGTLIVAATATFASAQQAAAPQPAPVARVMAELAATGHRAGFKNAPFSAEEVNESVQMLADGNRIARTTTGKFYRNSEGRTRREIAGGVGGVLGSVYTMGQGVSIADPVAGQRYLLDTNLKTARVGEFKTTGEVAVASAARNQAELERVRTLGKMQAELHASKVDAVAPVAVISGQGGFATTINSNNGLAYVSSGAGSISKYETRTEELGTRDFEGVSAEGTRRTTTIPAGAIGNERPIEIVYERWYSKELGLTVYSKNTDPRSGEQTYKLVNIVRAEPDPALFALPTGYKVTGIPTTGKQLVTPKTVVGKPTAKTTPVIYKKNFVD